ncbi:MAG: hypothetical protein SGBAC_005648 [Bacillariaceae sp.]
MRNTYKSKASQDTNESSKKEKSYWGVWDTNKVKNEKGTYPSPGSSPYALEEDEDAPVLVARRPSTPPFPHVNVVDGSLTFDNVPTPPAVSTAADDDNTKKVKGTTEDLLQAVDSVKENERKVEDKVADAKPSAEVATSEPQTADDYVNEDKLLSLLTSDLDLSAIDDLKIPTPSEANQVLEFLVDKIWDEAVNAADKSHSDMEEETAAAETASPKSEEIPVPFESKGTRLGRVGKKMKRICKLRARPAVLLSVLLAASLLFIGTRYAINSLTPTPAPMLRVVVNDTATIQKDDSVTLNHATHANVLLELNASGTVEESTVKEEMKLQDLSAGIRASVTSYIPSIFQPEITFDLDHGSREFPLHVEYFSSCGTSQWDLGMTMPQIALLAMLLLASTSIFGSKRTKNVHPKPEPVKHEHCVSSLTIKELENYDLSKYFGEHTVVQLREMLRARKCKTIGKKNILVQRLASVYRAELETLTVVQLRRILKSKNFTQGGSKVEIIRALVEECP